MSKLDKNSTITLVARVHDNQNYERKHAENVKMYDKLVDVLIKKAKN